MTEEEKQGLDTFSNSLVTVNEIRDLELKKQSLIQEIANSEKIIESLDSIILNHSATKEKYAGLCASIDSMFETKGALQNEIDNLQAKVDQKESVSKEVEKYKGMVKVLQQEMIDFDAQFEKTKQYANQYIDSAKGQLRSLYKDIGNVIDQL